jgi:hypothetical protein
MKSLAFAVALSLAATPLSALAAGNCKKAGHHTTKCASHLPTPTGVVAAQREVEQCGGVTASRKTNGDRRQRRWVQELIEDTEGA